VSDEAHIELVPDIEVSVNQLPPVVVSPGSTIKIDTAGGAVIPGRVDARDFTGRDVNQNDLRYNSAGSSVTFLDQDNAALWQANMKLLQDIASVSERLDGIPNRLQKLEDFLFMPIVSRNAASQHVWFLLAVIAIGVGGLLIGKLL
jgi:hypothetical protein